MMQKVKAKSPVTFWVLLFISFLFLSTCGGGGGGDSTSQAQPIYNPSFASIANVQDTQADIQVQISEDGTAYFVVLDAEATAPTASQVRAGQDSTGAYVAENRKGTIKLSANTVGIITVTNLEPAGNYSVFIAIEDKAPSLWSTVQEVTIRTVGWKFVVVGDSRGSVTNGINTTILYSIRDRILEMNPRPALIIFTGDLVTVGSVAALQYWKTHFMDVLQAQGVKVYPVIGNHDTDNAGTTAWSSWKAVFGAGIPDNGPTGNDDTIYRVDHNNASFFVIRNWDDGVSAGIDSQTNDWLQNQYRDSSSKAHRFIACHSPILFGGTTTHSPLYGGDSPVRDTLVRGALTGGVSAWIAGHNHLVHVSSMAYPEGDFYQFQLGSAGAPLVPLGGTLLTGQTELVSQSSFGYAVITVADNNISAIVYYLDSAGNPSGRSAIISFRGLSSP